MQSGRPAASGGFVELLVEVEPVAVELVLLPLNCAAAAARARRFGAHLLGYRIPALPGAGARRR